MHALYRWMHACSCIARRARPATAEHARSIVGHMLSRTQAVALPVSFRPGKTASTGPAVQDHYHPFPHSSRSNALQRPRGPDVCARASLPRALLTQLRGPVAGRTGHHARCAALQVLRADFFLLLPSAPHLHATGCRSRPQRLPRHLHATGCRSRPQRLGSRCGECNAYL